MTKAALGEEDVAELHKQPQEVAEAGSGDEETAEAASASMAKVTRAATGGSVYVMLRASQGTLWASGWTSKPRAPNLLG